MVQCLIALGANLGDRAGTLDRAIDLLRQAAGIHVAAFSHWLETAPVGGPAGQGAFLNGAALLETELPAALVLERLHEVERTLGRERRERWAARTLDLDILLYGQQTIDGGGLNVPHPRMPWRRFVLEPAAEIAPALVHPTSGWTIGQLAGHLRHSRPYVAIAGDDAGQRRALGEAIAERTGARLIDAPSARDIIADQTGSHAEQMQRALDWSQQLVSFVDSEVAPGKQWIVSDFWADQLLDELRRQLRREELSELEPFAGFQTVRPRVLVALTSNNAGGPTEQVLATADVGPVLRLASGDVNQAAAEVVAAMQASE